MTIQNPQLKPAVEQKKTHMLLGDLRRIAASKLEEPDGIDHLAAKIEEKVVNGRTAREKETILAIRKDLAFDWLTMEHIFEFYEDKESAARCFAEAARNFELGGWKRAALTMYSMAHRYFVKRNGSGGQHAAELKTAIDRLHAQVKRDHVARELREMES